MTRTVPAFPVSVSRPAVVRLGALALRSRYVLRSGVKRHFVDPSLAVAALRATPQVLLRDLKLLGFLFESLVVRDLRVYGQANDAEVLQYRDSNGLEVDAIVQIRG